MRALNSPTDPAAQTKDIGHAAKSLSWGRWTNGYVARGNDDAVILNANDNIHYLIGLPTASSALPTSGAVVLCLIKECCILKGSQAPFLELGLEV